MLNLKSLFKGNIFGMPTTGQDDWKLNRLTLAFSGEIKQY